MISFGHGICGIEGFMSKKYKVWIFWALMLIGALLVVSQSSYSDGDDAFFYQYTNSMGFG